jgi:hypothetical protein
VGTDDGDAAFGQGPHRSGQRYLGRGRRVCDEKSQIQALDRTAATLPMQPGRAASWTHDYRRRGTTTLFAALGIATGEVTAGCKPQNRHQEFLAFCKQVARAYPTGELHLVMDNLWGFEYRTRCLPHGCRTAYDQHDRRVFSLSISQRMPQRSSA